MFILRWVSLPLLVPPLPRPPEPEDDDEAADEGARDEPLLPPDPSFFVDDDDGIAEALVADDMADGLMDRVPPLPLPPDPDELTEMRDCASKELRLLFIIQPLPGLDCCCCCSWAAVGVAGPLLFLPALLLLELDRLRKLKGLILCDDEVEGLFGLLACVLLRYSGECCIVSANARTPSTGERRGDVQRSRARPKRDAQSR